MKRNTPAQVLSIRLTEAELGDLDELCKALHDEPGLDEWLRDYRQGPYGRVSRGEAVAEAVRRTLRELRPPEPES